MNAIDLLRAQLAAAHDYLEATVSDVTPEQAAYQPAGLANSIGATYAHAVLAEDLIVNGMLRQAAPLLATTYGGRTGVSEPMPTPGPEWVRYAAWTRSVRVDMPTLRRYAQAVYGASNDYLASLTPEALDQTIDLSMLGMGQVSLAWMLSRLVISHSDTECGEVSAIKGIQGARGYPV